MVFALYFGNRGFFPGELVAAARQEMIEAVTSRGHGYIVMSENETKFGAIEGVEDGKKYAAFLKRNEGAFDGVIMCLPNFGDENGAVYALRDANVPILIQAYPDEIGKMDFASRRDSYCGKFSIMDMFTQYDIPFTAFKPHVCHPLSREFLAQIDKFCGVCRVVKGMKRFSVGAIGARTTKFKTVRYDELTLQKYGITVDCIDLSEVFYRCENYADGAKVSVRERELKSYADFSRVKADKLMLIAKVSLVLEDYIAEYNLDTLALRCWDEFPQIMNISVCVVVSFLNDKGVPVACEMDVCNAVTMNMLSLASGNAATCLDWNNNYGAEENKCILFHCGPVAKSLMTDSGVVTDHKMFAKSYGSGCAFGSLEGRIAPCNFTFASSKTEDGKLKMYMGKGKFTDDEIEDAYFGCGGVAEIDNLEDTLMYIGKNGYRHHVSVTNADVLDIISEAAKTYLGYDIEILNR